MPHVRVDSRNHATTTDILGTKVAISQQVWVYLGVQSDLAQALVRLVADLL
jgi:hypothetical protein